MRSSFSGLSASLAFALGVCLGLNACTGLQLDQSMAPALANDATLSMLPVPRGTDPQVEGCNQLRDVGYLFCRIRTGSNPTSLVTFILPPAQCARATCVQWQIVRKDGSFGASGTLPKGQVRAQVPISQLIGSDSQVGPEHDGEYQIVLKAYFTGPDGHEYKSVTRGIVRIVVLSSAYVPLSCNDPNVAWEVKLRKSGSCRVQFSTSLRAVLCGNCEPS